MKMHPASASPDPPTLGRDRGVGERIISKWKPSLHFEGSLQLVGAKRRSIFRGAAGSFNWLTQKGVSRLLATLSWCSFVVLVTGGIAWAAEGGTSMWPDFFYRLLNFSVMVGLLIFVFKKFDLKGFFTKRTEKIANTLNELEAKKKEAEKTYEEYKEKLALLDKETDRILQEYVEQGEREKAKIIANAEKAAAEIREQTDVAIEQEIKSAKAELQREIAELSVTAAETMLKEKIGEKDQKKLVDDFMTKVVEAK